MVLHQHIAPWDAQIVEYRISIVFQLEALLWSDVSCLDAFDGLECGLVSDWNKENMNSVSFFVDDKLGVYSCVVAVDSEISNPPLGRSYFRSVDDEAFSRCVVGGCSEQILNI